MSLSERSRSLLRTGLCAVVEDEEAVDEMLSHFPTRDIDAPVTRDHLRAEVAGLRAEMADLRTEMADLRTEMVAGLARVEGRMADQMEALRKDVSATMRNWILGGMGLVVAAAGVVVAIVRATAGA